MGGGAYILNMFVSKYIGLYPRGLMSGAAYIRGAYMYIRNDMFVSK